MNVRKINVPAVYVDRSWEKNSKEKRNKNESTSSLMSFKKSIKK